MSAKVMQSQRQGERQNKPADTLLTKRAYVDLLRTASAVCRTHTAA